MALPKKAPVIRCSATRPDELRVRPCECLWSRFEAVEDAGDLSCDECGDTGYAPVSGDLGGTHSYPSRPFTFDIVAQRLTVTRGKKVETYEIAELEIDPTREHPDARGFEFAKQSDGTLHNLFVSGERISCDCGGSTWGSTSRANWNAYLDQREQHQSRGCLHSDFLALALAAGLLKE